MVALRKSYRLPGAFQDVQYKFPLLFVSSQRGIVSNNNRNMARIYVASSWRNPYHADAVRRLREAGHEVYDFRNPPHGGSGFRWSDVDPGYMEWDVAQYRAGLESPLAKKQFASDLDALNWADTCVLVLPCGRSAHTEAGWMSGRGRKTIAYIPEMQEAELMYKLFDLVTGDLDEIIAFLHE